MTRKQPNKPSDVLYAAYAFHPDTEAIVFSRGGFVDPIDAEADALGKDALYGGGYTVIKHTRRQWELNNTMRTVPGEVVASSPAAHLKEAA